MKATLIFVCCLVIWAAFAWPTSDRRMHKFIKFIEANTELVYNNEPLPTLHRGSHEELCKVLYDPAPENCDVAGYYNDETNQIWIANTPTKHMVEEGFVDVVIVHELVHFLQRNNGVYESVKCRRELEADAYKVQDLFVIENGLPDKQRPDPLFSMIASRCNDDFGGPIRGEH